MAEHEQQKRLIKPISSERIVRAVAVDLNTLVEIGAAVGCGDTKDFWFCDLPPNHEGPHESRVPALVTLHSWSNEIKQSFSGAGRR